MPRPRLSARERGDDEPRISLALRPLRLGDDAAPAAPAVERAPLEVLEAARRLSALLGHRPGSGKLRLDHGDQPRVARQPEHIVHAICLAPRHHGLTRKAAIGPQQDAHIWPAGADLPDGPLDLLHATGAGVDVGGAQLGGQQVPPAEHVERQIAVAVVIAVEKAALLVPVQRIVRGVKVEDDLLGRPFVRFQEQPRRQRLDRDFVAGNLVVARRLLPAQFQPVRRRR